MQETSPSARSLGTRGRRLAALGRAAVVCLIVCLLPACSGIDPEYNQKLAMARTDCVGNEIAGIWVSKFTGGVGSRRLTLLLRPDGTGQMTEVTSLRNRWEYTITWHYSGGGVWNGTFSIHRGDSSMAGGIVTVSPGEFPLVIRYTGSGLVMQAGQGKIVFVSSDNAAAVEEHLKKR